MKKKFLPGAFSRIAGLLLASGLQIQAATHYVGVSDAGFSPATLPIATGDTVVWVNYDETFPHTTTSDLSFFDPNYWDGVLVSEFDTFSRTFNNAGSFMYYDQLGPGRGTITVGVPVPTLIVLESPRIESDSLVFEATGLTPGQSNVLQSSTNLSSWTSLSTNLALTSSMTFTNPANSDRRYFRLFQMP